MKPLPRVLLSTVGGAVVVLAPPPTHLMVVVPYLEQGAVAVGLLVSLELVEMVAHGVLMP